MPPKALGQRRPSQPSQANSTGNLGPDGDRAGIALVTTVTRGRRFECSGIELPACLVVHLLPLRWRSFQPASWDKLAGCLLPSDRLTTLRRQSEAPTVQEVAALKPRQRAAALALRA